MVRIQLTELVPKQIMGNETGPSRTLWLAVGPERTRKNRPVQQKDLLTVGNSLLVSALVVVKVGHWEPRILERPTLLKQYLCLGIPCGALGFTGEQPVNP